MVAGLFFVLKSYVIVLQRKKNYNGYMEYISREVTETEDRKRIRDRESWDVSLSQKSIFHADGAAVRESRDPIPSVPKEMPWKSFRDSLDNFTEDIFEKGRDQGMQEERESL